MNGIFVMNVVIIWKVVCDCEGDVYEVVFLGGCWWVEDLVIMVMVVNGKFFGYMFGILVVDY